MIDIAVPILVIPRLRSPQALSVREFCLAI
jgi:hypothetical protein